MSKQLGFFEMMANSASKGIQSVIGGAVQVVTITARDISTPGIGDLVKRVHANDYPVGICGDVYANLAPASQAELEELSAWKRDLGKGVKSGYQRLIDFFYVGETADKKSLNADSASPQVILVSEGYELNYANIMQRNSQLAETFRGKNEWFYFVNYAFSGMKQEIGAEAEVQGGGKRKFVELAVLDQVSRLSTKLLSSGANLVGGFFECENVGKMELMPETVAKLEELGLDIKNLDNDSVGLYSGKVRKAVAALEKGDETQQAVAEEIKTLKSILVRPALFGSLAEKMIDSKIEKETAYIQPPLGDDPTAYCEQLNCFFMRMPGYGDMPAIRKLAFLDAFYNYFTESSVFEHMDKNQGVKQMVEGLEARALQEHAAAKEAGKEVGKFDQQQYLSDFNTAGFAAETTVSRALPAGANSSVRQVSGGQQPAIAA